MENIKNPETVAEKFAELEKFIDILIQENKIPRPVIIEVDSFIKDVKEFIENNSEQPKN